MKIKCVGNKGSDLTNYEYNNEINFNKFGRFGATRISEYNELIIGETYIVMGIYIFNDYQGFLIDSLNLVGVYPCQLFEVIDNRMFPQWHFRIIDKNELMYPFIQAIIGYSELCTELNSYEKLIVDKDTISYANYFKNKSLVMNWDNNID
jgi:hypothetical protein